MDRAAYANAVYAVRIIHNADLVGAEKYSALAAAIAAEVARWAAGDAAFNAARSARSATWYAALAARHAAWTGSDAANAVDAALWVEKYKEMTGE